MKTLVTTDKSPYRKAGTIFKCTDQMAETLIKKGFAIEEGQSEPKPKKTTKK